MYSCVHARLCFCTLVGVTQIQVHEKLTVPTICFHVFRFYQKLCMTMLVYIPCGMMWDTPHLEDEFTHAMLGKTVFIGCS